MERECSYQEPESRQTFYFGICGDQMGFMVRIYSWGQNTGADMKIRGPGIKHGEQCKHKAWDISEYTSNQEQKRR